MRKIIYNSKELEDEPVDVSQVSLDLVHVVAINKFSKNTKGFVVRFQEGNVGLIFPQKQSEYNSATNVRGTDLIHLIKNLKNDYDFYIL